MNIADIVERTETLAVAPGASAKFHLDEKLPETATAGQASVAVSQGEQQLYYYTVPF